MPNLDEQLALHHRAPGRAMHDLSALHASQVRPRCCGGTSGGAPFTPTDPTCQTSRPAQWWYSPAWLLAVSFVRYAAAHAVNKKPALTKAAKEIQAKAGKPPWLARATARADIKDSHNWHAAAWALAALPRQRRGTFSCNTETIAVSNVQRNGRERVTKNSMGAAEYSKLGGAGAMTTMKSHSAAAAPGTVPRRRCNRGHSQVPSKPA